MGSVEQHRAAVRARQLADLRWRWGQAYVFTWASGTYRAVRRDGGAPLASADAWRLRALVREDYQANPVPREVQAAGHDEYPQRIADDYPGWGVAHEAGHWMAWCPAVTVHAYTAAGLRVAIERAIAGDDG